jgi:catechol 2,3-dioxygenase-like lactoylglutathione lyase family enzyme
VLTAVEILGLAWLGVRTERFAAMTSFFEQVLGLSQRYGEPGFSVYRLPDDATIEVFGPESPYNGHFESAPVAGFLVRDVDAAVAEFEANGVRCLHRGDSDDGAVWAHFRGPDGNLYEVCSSREHAPSEIPPLALSDESVRG